MRSQQKMKQCDHCPTSPFSVTTTTIGSQELLDCIASLHSSFFSSQSYSLPRISSRSPYSIMFRYFATSSFSMKIYSFLLNNCVRDRISADDQTYTSNLNDFTVRQDFMSSESDSMAGSSFRKDTSGASCFSTTMGSRRLAGAFSLCFRTGLGVDGCYCGMEWVEGPTMSAGAGWGSTFSVIPLAERVLFFSKRMTVRFFSSFSWGRLVASAMSCSTIRCSDFDFRLASGCLQGEGYLCSLMESSEGNWFSFYSRGLGWWATAGTGCFQ